MQHKKRLFIALNLPSEAKKLIAPAIDSWQTSYPAAKWTRPEDIHLTLHFLGNIQIEKLEKIKLIMQSLVGKFQTFTFKLSSISAFPNQARPKVIFFACAPQGSRSIFKLHEIIGLKMSQEGFEIDGRQWQLHITIARIRDKFPSFEYTLPDNLKNLEFTIRSIDLMESELKPEGPVYDVLEKFELA